MHENILCREKLGHDAVAISTGRADEEFFYRRQNRLSAYLANAILVRQRAAPAAVGGTGTASQLFLNDNGVSTVRIKT